MKTTVRAGSLAVLIEPIPNSPEIRLSLRSGQSILGSVDLKPDQVGAIEFGMEMALEVNEVRTQRVAV